MKFQPLNLLLLFVIFSAGAFAQDEETAPKKLCNEDLNKKAVNLYEKALDKKKYKKAERLEFLTKALELEPDFAEAYLAVGFEFALTCRVDNKPFTVTLPFFYKAIGLCPQIHSEPYYYIGYDYYERRMNPFGVFQIHQDVITIIQSSDSCGNISMVYNVVPKVQITPFGLTGRATMISQGLGDVNIFKTSVGFELAALNTISRICSSAKENPIINKIVFSFIIINIIPIIIPIIIIIIIIIKIVIIITSILIVVY